MTYYVGFRFGWLRAWGLTIGWSDPAIYPRAYGRCVRGWKVWAAR